jgi:hypothetical protein
MHDPFCKNELLDPELEQMVERINCGCYDRDEKINDTPDEPEGTACRNPDGTVVIFPPAPVSVRYLPKNTPIEVKNRYRGFYVCEGIMIVTEKCMTSLAEGHIFERVWVRLNPCRVRLEPEWKVSRIS